MDTGSIQFGLLFDADEYRRAGHCPWTFFAYPSSLGDDRGLPPDADACRLLGELQGRGIAVSIWINGIGNGTTYFACRKGDIQLLNDTLSDLESRGLFEKDFFRKRSEQLFLLPEQGT